MLAAFYIHVYLVYTFFVGGSLFIHPCPTKQTSFVCFLVDWVFRKCQALRRAKEAATRRAMEEQQQQQQHAIGAATSAGGGAAAAALVRNIDISDIETCSIDIYVGGGYIYGNVAETDCRRWRGVSISEQ